jgi:TAP-like protein
MLVLSRAIRPLPQSNGKIARSQHLGLGSTAELWKYHLTGTINMARRSNLEYYAPSILGEYRYAAKNGDASGLSTSPTSSAFEGTAISCLDWYHAETSLVDLKYKQELNSALWPHVKGGEYGLNYCIGWPIPQVNKDHRASITGIPRILQVNSQHDPACSYIWAKGLRKQISNSTILTRRGDGYTSYLLFGEAWEAMNASLVNLTIPADNSFVDS